ncbi:ACT domain-containing protein [Bowmanella yangjiangensis]|uniref:ACT domain-containing protein n=1 Tax=Bowmanella yangjiangensis TaxID=2811230 RepID=A0ABS3CXW6_9ALTE|nr:ACT domain-containing protein [Bowmanella yangjiangensis]MBN7821961.1 ACT domain-containing protein [Bowmanella yangjiangensis]
MSAISNLDVLISSMQPELQGPCYVFAFLPHHSPLPEGAKMLFEEQEGWTAILPIEQAKVLGLHYEFACRMITLNVHSSLDAVGFLARITRHLAALGMGVNPVSAFFHDHLFVPAERAEEALAALRQLSAERPLPS